MALGRKFRSFFSIAADSRVNLARAWAWRACCMFERAPDTDPRSTNQGPKRMRRLCLPSEQRVRKVCVIGGQWSAAHPGAHRTCTPDRIRCQRNGSRTCACVLVG